MTAGPATTVDAFLGGRVEAIQPASGHHRAGLEAVLLGAALPTSFEGLVVDLGAGAGVAGFCHAARCPNSNVLLVERDAELVAAATEAASRSANAAFAPRVATALVDITAPETARIASGWRRDAGAAVLMNPPFYRAGEGRRSPSEARAEAHTLSDGLDPWFRAAAWSLRAGGSLVAIVAAASLAELLGVLDGRFGAAAILPIHPRPNSPALRLIVHAIRGSRAPVSILPGLTLHAAERSAFAPPIQSVLTGEADLRSIHAGWQGAVGGG